MSALIRVKSPKALAAASINLANASNTTHARAGLVRAIADDCDKRAAKEGAVLAFLIDPGLSCRHCLIICILGSSRFERSKAVAILRLAVVWYDSRIFC